MSSPRFANRRAVFAVVGLTAVAACSKQEGAPQGRGAVPVTVVTLATAPVVLRRELPGRTTPYLVAEVRPQVNGIVKQRLYTEGSAVKAGQPLYQLDDATYQADLASARAALARAEATLNTARLNSRRSADLFAINAVSKQAKPTLPLPRRLSAAQKSSSATHASRRRSAAASASPP
jgi:membrane fusion protein, multidrug efflux system